MQHSNTAGCILLKFYIKPQLRNANSIFIRSCILLKFYIKPQLRLPLRFLRFCCILLKFYIKPQLPLLPLVVLLVVSY